MKKHSFSRNYATLMLCGLVLPLLFYSSALAQTGTSTVRGTVTDQQGRVIAGATVTLIDTEKNFTRTQVTSGEGTYSFTAVPPGTYRVEAEASGFKKGIVTDVQALVDKPTDANVKLEVGNVSESVTISSGTGEVLINKEDASLGNNFVNRQITQLPLEARNVPSLLTLQPGVTKEGYVNGARSDQSNITLDGVDINEAQTSQIGQVNPTGGAGSNETSDVVPATSPDRNTVIRLNAEAIEEFRVTTANANANQGRSSGAQISLVTKSGTNEFHGALFEYHRNTVFTANDFFNNRNGRFVATDADVILGLAKVGDIRNPRPTLIRNTFGGALGGPIIKDKAFFFYSYEGRRDASQQTAVRVVPLPSLGLGQVRYVNPSGGVTTLSPADIKSIFPATGGINPVATAALAQAAAKYRANDFTVGDSRVDRLLNTAGFRFNAPTPVRLNSHSIRLDYNLTSKQVLFLRGNVIYDFIGGIPQFPDTPTPDTWSHPWGFVVGHTWTINNRMVNNLRYGLTREAFTTLGDSNENATSFRFIFSPRAFTRTIERTTPVQNITDDLSWVKGNHTAQFGTNIRLIRNNRISFANAFDNAIDNPSFFPSSSISNSVNAFSPIGPGFRAVVQNAAVAVIGRFSQYTANFNFDKQGNLLPVGVPTQRTFATQEYDAYAQDGWKIRPNLTMTYGLRYSLGRPVYETHGFETKTNIPLSDFFNQRVESAGRGVPFNDPIAIVLSGPANGQSPLYHWDKTNFQPRIALAWSPNFKGGLLGKIFGTHNQSVFRTGFGITNDYYGEQLAVTFDLNNTLGFSSNTTISANTFNLTSNPGPLFTGFGQPVRSLPDITIPGHLTFPDLKPSDGARRIESSLDENIVAPIHYSWNLTFERELPRGLVIQASYIGRYAKHLIASRDTMALNDLVDPQSHMDWYTAATQLEILRARGIPISAVPAIPYFENLFGSFGRSFAVGLLGSRRAGLVANATQAVYADAFIFNGNDWTQTQDDIESATGQSFFFHPQYGALSTFGSYGRSDYHAGTISVRQRLGNHLTMDFNYTLSHARDDASGLSTSGAFGNAFILNPLRQSDWYADSDFDVRHIININGVWELPVGRGRTFLSNTNKFVDAVLGGWQLSGIFRWNSGLPATNPFDDARWATNWNVQSDVVRIRDLQTCPTRGGVDPPKLFGCDPVGAYQSFRNARPGESGDRNVFRLPGFISLDMGLGKTFTMPWSEHHKLQFRWDTFNVTNTQRLGRVDTSRTGTGVTLDPSQNLPPSNWSNFTSIQGSPRVMQFGLRYSF